jgi:hypothetical protein
MLSLDPRWLSIELEAVERDQAGWDKVLTESYELAVKRVLEYQSKQKTDREMVHGGPLSAS